MRISTKLLYLALLFALGFMGIIARLYSMQVKEDSVWRRGDEVTSSRLSIFYPNRARILDRHGVVLADNESVWDVHLNYYELTDPRNFLKHVQASDAFGVNGIEPSVAWYEANIVPVIKADYPDAQRARRFLDLWKQRNDPVLQHDRRIALGVLADLFDAKPEDLERRWALIEHEVEAILRPALSDPTASRSSLNRAYWQAVEAMSDLEYWEEIRRFPKSIELEVQLDERLIQARRIKDLLGTLRKEVDQSEDYVSELLLRSSAAVASEVSQSRARLPVIETTDEHFELVREPFAALPSEERQLNLRNQEIVNSWLALQDIIFEATARSHQVDRVVELLDLVLIELEGRENRAESLLPKHILEDLADWRINPLEDRLKRLRRRIYIEDEDGKRELRPEYGERWVSYLTYSDDAEEALRDNPLLITKDARREDVEAAKAYADLLPGIRFVARSDRFATMPTLMPSLLGAVSLPGPDEIDHEILRLTTNPNLQTLASTWFGGDLEVMGRSFKGQISQEPIGMSGIEGFYEVTLAGQPGARVTYNDARGRVRAKEGEWNPQPSEDLHLTIDAGLQEFAIAKVAEWEPILRAKVLEKENRSSDIESGRHVINTPFKVIGQEHWSLRGAVVVMDIETGDILCMVSFPDYDAELIAANTPEGKAYRDQVLRVESDESIPVWARKARFMNRASGAAFAPGSTFKALTAIALLEEGCTNASQTYVESPVYKGKGFSMRTSHAATIPVNLSAALEWSSNGYFWHMTENIPGASAADRYTRVLKPWAERFGFGSDPGLDVDGFVADGHFAPITGYSAKELANNAIGQGQFEASPLQVCRLYAAVANRGTLLEPRLSTAKPVTGETIPVSNETWDAVQKGLRDVVAGANGTGRKQQVLRRIRAAGKTGTAQVGYLSLKDRGEALKDREVVKPDHAWFAGYAPFDNPKIAFVVLAEYSNLGGADTGNLIGEIAEECLARNYGIDTRPSQNRDGKQVSR